MKSTDEARGGASTRGGADHSSGDPSTEERLLGAAAHLLLFMGLWVIGPLAIYYWQKERSRFVAFHAVQATLTALLMAVVGTVGGVLLFAGMLTSGIVLGQFGKGDLVGLGIVATLAIGLVASLLPTAWALYAAWRAYRGECWRIPIIGRVAARLVPESRDGERLAEPASRCRGGA